MGVGDAPREFLTERVEVVGACHLDYRERVGCFAYAELGCCGQAPTSAVDRSKIAAVAAAYAQADGDSVVDNEGTDIEAVGCDGRDADDGCCGAHYGPADAERVACGACWCAQEQSVGLVGGYCVPVDGAKDVDH